MLHAGQSAKAFGLILQAFPGEEPERAELEDWLDEASSMLRRNGFAAAMRGDTPEALLDLLAAKDVPDVAALDDEERTAAGRFDAAKHDLLVAKAARDKASAERRFHSGLREHQNRLAAVFESALRPNASLRLKELQSKHEYTSTPGCYDGRAMYVARPGRDALDPVATSRFPHARPRHRGDA